MPGFFFTPNSAHANILDTHTLDVDRCGTLRTAILQRIIYQVVYDQRDTLMVQQHLINSGTYTLIHIQIHMIFPIIASFAYNLHGAQ